MLSGSEKNKSKEREKTIRTYKKVWRDSVS